MERFFNVTEDQQLEAMLERSALRQQEVTIQLGDQVRRAFEIVLNRRPRPEEIDKFSQFGGSLDIICRVLLNSNEFLYVE